jgi:hypothetical protein
MDKLALVGLELSSLSLHAVATATLLSFVVFWLLSIFLGALPGGGSREAALEAILRIHAVVLQYAPKRHLLEFDAVGAYMKVPSVVNTIEGLERPVLARQGDLKVCRTPII